MTDPPPNPPPNPPPPPPPNPPPPDGPPEWFKTFQTEVGNTIKGLTDQIGKLGTGQPPPPRDLAAELDALKTEVTQWLQPKPGRKPNLFERTFLGHPKPEEPKQT